MPVRQFLLWDRIPGATGYSIQLASDDAFTTILREIPYHLETQYLTDVLAAGTYYWRTRGVDLFVTGDWSVGRSFVVQSAWVQPEYQDAPASYPSCEPTLLRR